MYYCSVGIYVYRLISYRVKITLNNNNNNDMAQSLALSSSTQNSEKLFWLHPIIGIVVLS